MINRKFDMHLKATDRTSEIILFAVTAMAWSWLWWAPRVLASFGVLELPAGVDAALATVGALGPALAAFYWTRREHGKDAALKLWKRAWRVKFEVQFLLAAVLVMPVIGALTTGALALAGVEDPWQYALMQSLNVPMVVLLLAAAAGEEFGWRGYALERLQGILNPLKASLLLGLVWGVWQLPLHFVFGTLQASLPVLQIIFQAMAVSILFTWLYNKTAGSVLVAIIFHFFGSLSGLVFPVWVGAVGQWAHFFLTLAAIVVLAMINGIRRYKKL
jgi:membrane protease YdiL (CAAX protease family)